MTLKFLNVSSLSEKSTLLKLSIYHDYLFVVVWLREVNDWDFKICIERAAGEMAQQFQVLVFLFVFLFLFFFQGTRVWNLHIYQALPNADNSSSRGIWYLFLISAGIDNNEHVSITYTHTHTHTHIWNKFKDKLLYVLKVPVH